MFLRGAAFGGLSLAFAAASLPAFAAETQADGAPVPLQIAAPEEPAAITAAPQAGNAAAPLPALHLPPPRLPVGGSAELQPDVPPPQLPDVVVTFDAPKLDPVILPPDLPPVVVEFAPAAKSALPPRPVTRAEKRTPAPPAAVVILPPELPPVVVALPEMQKPAAAPVAAAPAQPPLPATVQPPAAAQLTRDDMRLAAEALLRSELPQGLRAPQQVQQLRKEREALVAFYAARDYAPLWIADAAWTNAARSAMARVALGADDGLDLAAYSLPRLDAAAGAGAALAELRLSEAVSAYARQASGSRVDPARLSSLITARPLIPLVAHALATVAAAGDAGAALLAFNPPQAAYRNLRIRLHQLRAPEKSATVSYAPVPPGPPLRVGMRDARVPLLRVRFGLLAGGADDMVYDALVAAAISDFQRANSLPATGVLTPRTIAALGGGEPVRLENEILANMERWRWMPRDMGDSRIEVNIPDYVVNVFHNNGLIHSTRAVVGKPDTPTPVFSETMEYLIVNPSWNVPQSIIQKEMLPRLANDPDYLARQGYEVIQKGDTLIVRQPPGERNALGRIKFMFPNQHAVYLHDTPSRALFANEKRAYSHGCVRVDQPFRLAEVLLGRDNGWSEERVKALVGGGERTIHLPRPLPIHIMYFTAVADETGAVQLKDDIYGYSRRVKGALGLEGEAYVEARPKPRAAVRIRLPVRVVKRQTEPLAITPVVDVPVPVKPKQASIFNWFAGQ